MTVGRLAFAVVVSILLFQTGCLPTRWPVPRPNSELKRQPEEVRAVAFQEMKLSRYRGDYYIGGRQLSAAELQHALIQEPGALARWRSSQTNTIWAWFLGPLAGSAFILGGAFAADAASRPDCDVCTTASLISFGVGAVLVIPTVLTAVNASSEKEATFRVYNERLRERLRLPPERPGEVRPGSR